MSDATFWRGRNETADRVTSDLNTDLDHLFGLLSHPRRRALLYMLYDGETDPVWTTNLAVQLARMEADEDEDPTDVAEEVALTLRHNHLPKLAEAGLIDGDASMTTFSYRGDDQVEDLLRWSEPREEMQGWLHTE